MTDPVVVITGGAKRIGNAIAREFHAHQYRVIVHYRHSADDATALVNSLNALRPASAIAMHSDLDTEAAITHFATNALAYYGRVDTLINNASSFFPTPLNTLSSDDWDNLMHSNAKLPLWLSTALAPALKETRGSIISIADIYGMRPLAEHAIYSMAKASNMMLTQSLARELAPQVRANGIAPGAILMPEHNTDALYKQQLLAKTPLATLGEPNDIAQAAYFLATARFITGHILPVDGGRHVMI